MTAPFLEYLRAGLSVIPIRADGSKAAAIAWKPFIERRATEAEAAEWATRHEGVAVVAGAVSGNLEVIDVDEPALVRPYLEAVRAEDPSLYDRLCLIRTPRRNESGQGGCHIVYRCEVAIGGNAKLAMSEPEPVVDAAGKPVIDPTTGKPKTAPRTLVETRGEGGYIVTVGSSPRCHPSGRCYEHVHGPTLTDLATLTGAERETLHRVARVFDRSVAETHVDPPVRGYERVKTGDAPGDCFNRQASWAEILGPAGWQCVGESAGIKRWRRPGKATGWSGTTGVLSKAGNELFTCFSQNASPFEGVNASGKPGVCYSKFAAFAILNHRGDYEAAARALLKLGYGTPAAKREDPKRVLIDTAQDAERRYLAALQADELHLISLGIPALDRAIGGGVERGEMIVVGGLTSHGKSVIALQACRARVEARQHVVLVSHEMSALAVAKRLIQARTPRDTREWFDHVDELAADSRTYWACAGRLFILEQCRDIAQIEAEVGRIAAEFELGLIVIDHAQLTTEAKAKGRYETVTETSGRFKQLAMKHNCPILVPSQLNREAAKGEAQAHHLRESGALEQDADVIVLVNWPWKADPKANPDASRYVFKIVKNRNRPIVAWEVEARFCPARQTIETEGYTPPRNGFGEFHRFNGEQ